MRCSSACSFSSSLLATECLNHCVFGVGVADLVVEPGVLDARPQLGLGEVFQDDDRRLVIVAGDLGLRLARPRERKPLAQKQLLSARGDADLSARQVDKLNRFFHGSALEIRVNIKRHAAPGSWCGVQCSDLTLNQVRMSTILRWSSTLVPNSTSITCVMRIFVMS